MKSTVLQVKRKYNFQNFKQRCPTWVTNAASSQRAIKSNSVYQVLVICLGFTGQGGSRGTPNKTGCLATINTWCYWRYQREKGWNLELPRKFSLLASFHMTEVNGPCILQYQPTNQDVCKDKTSPTAYGHNHLSIGSVACSTEGNLHLLL